uniref:Uncharacterized protein n=1 Tax=Gossypium raimondii TaxID=29730 RepID=A0A0D2QG30_GOSRA|nr:hypothetical protein B456_006G244500 [Gossypium raimondii]
MRFLATFFSDKTGTPTGSPMKVIKFWVGQQEVASSISPVVVYLTHEGVALNTTDSFGFSDCPKEKAILSWAEMDLKIDMEKTKKSCVLIRGAEVLDFEQKRSGVLIGRNNGDTLHVHWKGPAEIILAMCSSYYDASGVVKDLNDGERAKFEQIIQGMAASNLSCIAFAHKQVQEKEYDDLKEKKQVDGKSLTLLGVVGIKDPCKPGVKKQWKIANIFGSKHQNDH